MASLLGYLLSAVKPELPQSPVIYVIYMLFMVMGHPGLYCDLIQGSCSTANYQRHNSMGGGLHILNHKQPELKVKKHLNPRKLLVKRHWHCTPMNTDPKHKLPEPSRERSRLHPPSPSASQGWLLEERACPQTNADGTEG